MARKDDLYVIKCYECGKVYSGIANKKSAVRAKAKAEGWTVAIPEWATQPLSKEEWLRDHRKGVTVDDCPDCMMRGNRNDMNRYSILEDIDRSEYVN